MSDTVQITLRLPRSLRDELTAAADERSVSASWLARRALADFLPRLVPVDEIRWTE